MNREFLWCSRRIVGTCQMTFRKPHHHIAISTPGTVSVDLGCVGDRLRLQFHDLGDDAPKEYWDGLFTGGHAREIKEFVEDREGLFVVNCEAGISRSAGTVLALRRFFGGDSDEVRRMARPNLFVVSLLFRSLLDGQPVARLTCPACGVSFSEEAVLLRRFRKEFGENVLCPGCRDEVSQGVRPSSRPG